jgi:DNA-binding NarL/FixJ family response regulator
MQTIRAILKDNTLKYIDDLPFPLEQAREYLVLITFIGTDLNTALFGDISQVDARKILERIRIGLSKRELEVLRLMQQGFTNIQIAQELKLGSGTVRNYTSSIYEKLKTSNRTGAIARSIELGILE